MALTKENYEIGVSYETNTNIWVAT